MLIVSKILLVYVMHELSLSHACSSLDYWIASGATTYSSSSAE
jgi:hypothetical protein